MNLRNIVDDIPTIFDEKLCSLIHSFNFQDTCDMDGLKIVLSFI